MMTENIKELAEKYLQLTEEDSDEEDHDIGSLKEEVQKWKTKMEGKDEEDRLYEIAESKYQEAKQKVEKLEERQNQLEETKQELLEKTANRFVPQDEWTDTEVIRAVSKVLIGQESSVLHVNDEEIDSEHSSEPEEIFEISERVRRLAEDTLGKTDEVEQFWNKFKEQKKFAPFKVLAEAGQKLDRSQIVERIDEDVDKNKVGSNIRSTIHNTDFNPYHREGGYGLSLTGKYLKKKYMNLTGEQEAEQQDQEEETEETVKQSSEDKSRQQKFYETVSE
jgi:hypothetical protein